MPTTATPKAAEVDVIVEAEGWQALDLEALAARAAEATLAQLRLPGPAEIALLATSDAAVARLNADFRGRPTPTNVLSWPARPLPSSAPGAVPPRPEPDATGELFLGDIALAWETCAREAEEGGKPLSDHATHLIVHAILHLMGYDHICDEDAALMEGLETEILRSLGLPDPYSGELQQGGQRSGAE
jgi:probable rRNA maturation factor